METLKTKIANIIANHSDVYDSDCGYDYGCSCGFNPTNAPTGCVPWDTDHIAELILEAVAESNK